MERSSYCIDKTVEPIYSGGSVSLASNGYLATCLGSDAVISDLETGQIVTRITGDSEVITCLAISPDGQYLVTCSRSLQMRTYALPAGTRVHACKAHDAPVISIKIDRSSTLVATGGAEGLVKVWDIKKGYVTHNFRGHGGIVSALQFYGDAKSNRWLLASGADDSHIKVWDLTKSSAFANLEGHASVIRGLDFSEDGNFLISGSRDKVIMVWALSQKKKRQLQNTILVNESIESCGFLNPGVLTGDASSQLIYSGGSLNEVKLWTIDGTPLKNNSSGGPSEVSLTDVIYDSVSGKLISVQSDQYILTHLVENMSLPVIRHQIGFMDEVIDMRSISDDVLAINTNSDRLNIISKQNGTLNSISAHRDIILCIDIDYSGKYIVTGSKDNECHLWEINVSEDGRSAFYERLASFVGHTGNIGAVALSKLPSSGRPEFLLSASQDRTIKRWVLPKDSNSKSRTMWTKVAHDKDINALDVAPNDSTFASASQDRSIKVWDLESGETIGVMRGHRRGVWSIQYSEYQEYLASASGDKTVKVWSLNDYSCLKTFEGHTNSVLKVSWLSKGAQIASAGSDGLVRIWSMKTGQASTTLDGHTDRVWALASTGDGANLITGGADSIVNYWKDVTEEEREAEAKEAQERLEKDQELQNYIHNNDWRSAIILGIELNQPRRLLSLFQEVVSTVHDEQSSVRDKNSVSGMAAVDEVLSTLSDDQLTVLLRRIRDWNTNVKTYHIAQTILRVVVRAYSPTKFVSLPDIRELVEAMLAYSERHYERIEGFNQDSWLLEYTLREMDEFAIPQSSADIDDVPMEMDGVVS